LANSLFKIIFTVLADRLVSIITIVGINQNDIMKGTDIRDCTMVASKAIDSIIME